MHEQTSKDHTLAMYAGPVTARRCPSGEKHTAAMEERKPTGNVRSQAPVNVSQSGKDTAPGMPGATTMRLPSGEKLMENGEPTFDTDTSHSPASTFQMSILPLLQQVARRLAQGEKMAVRTVVSLHSNLVTLTLVSTFQILAQPALAAAKYLPHGDQLAL